jgi:hypothetical protein
LTFELANVIKKDIKNKYYFINNFFLKKNISKKNLIFSIINYFNRKKVKWMMTEWIYLVVNLLMEK